MAQSSNDEACLRWPSPRASSAETRPGLRERLKGCDSRFEDLLCQVESSTSPGEDSPESGSFNSFNLSWHPTEGSQGHPELCRLSKAMPFSGRSLFYYIILSISMSIFSYLKKKSCRPFSRCVLIWILSYSRGHKPCLFFARGNCQNGPECRYCHLDHFNPPEKLDKNQRQAWSKPISSERGCLKAVKQMSQQQLHPGVCQNVKKNDSRHSLLLPHLQARAKECGFLQEAQEVLRMASGSEGPSSSNEPCISSKLRRKLHKAGRGWIRLGARQVFQKMNFSGSGKEDFSTSNESD